MASLSEVQAWFTSDRPIQNVAASLIGSGKDPQFPVLLANEWDEETNLTGWWISEKLDGVRAYWDGEKFISRRGNTFTAPPEFTAGLPKIHLDGELFLGRGKFHEGSGIARSPASDPRWFRLKFIVFDAPNAPGGFEHRLAYSNKLSLGKYAGVMKHSRLESMDQIKQLLDVVIGMKGEGLMARRPFSQYTRKRTDDLLKIKRWYDAEAKVVGYTEGKGWRATMNGAMWCLNDAGIKFKVGCKDKAQCQNPPPLGSIITYKYKELTEDKKPREPIFLRYRLPE